MPQGKVLNQSSTSRSAAVSCRTEGCYPSAETWEGPGSEPALVHLLVPTIVLRGEPKSTQHIYRIARSRMYMTEEAKRLKRDYHLDARTQYRGLMLREASQRRRNGRNDGVGELDH
jgi:hypothetical protein